MKKKEFIFIGALLAVSVLLCVYVYVLPHVKYGSIQITVDGELYGTYSLGKDQVIAIGDTKKSGTTFRNHFNIQLITGDT